MKISLVISILLAIIGTVSSLGLFILKSAYSGDNQFLIICMIASLLLAELLLYLQWRLVPPVTPFFQELNQLAPILAVFAIVLQFSTNNFIYILILIVTLYSWYQLRSKVKDISWSNPEERLVGLIFLRIILYAVVRTVIYTFALFSFQIQNELILINMITGIIILILIWGYNTIDIPIRD